MDFQTLKGHILDFAKGIIGAMLAAAILAALQYIGIHLPDLIHLLLPPASAITTIKITK